MFLAVQSTIASAICVSLVVVENDHLPALIVAGVDPSSAQLTHRMCAWLMIGWIANGQPGVEPPPMLMTWSLASFSAAAIESVRLPWSSMSSSWYLTFLTPFAPPLLR